MKQIYEAPNPEVDKIISELREEAKGKPENMSKDEEIATSSEMLTKGIAANVYTTRLARTVRCTAKLCNGE